MEAYLQSLVATAEMRLCRTFQRQAVLVTPFSGIIGIPGFLEGDTAGVSRKKQKEQKHTRALPAYHGTGVV
jgi:hypothetical protein